jgi:uncharacterized protein (TIGR00251 family)
MATGVRFAVYVQPRASVSEIVGWHDDALKIRLAAPPVDDAANVALVELLAKRLRVPKSVVTIVAGLASRRKTVTVDGVSAEQIDGLV